MAQPVADIHAADELAWIGVREREPIIRRLAAMTRISANEMQRACAELNLSRARVYDLVRRYRDNPVASALLASKPGPAIGSSRLAPDIDGLIERLIDQVDLTRQKPSMAAVYRAVAHECQALGIKCPSRWSIRVRIKRRPAATRMKMREGRKAASDKFRPVARPYVVGQVLEVVQVDHTLVDQIVVDERNREPLGRPWVTFAIDVATRMVVGFYLTLESPSATSVAMAIRHAVLPKDAWLGERGLEVSWNAAGLPDCLHMDNAKEFHSKALARGCDEYGIERRFRPPATPHFGGHIERLIGTMMGAVHLLPGTTFSDIASKGGNDPVATSAMTLSELESWLAWQIAGVYHATVHRGLEIPPNVAWERAVARRQTPIRHPADPQRFLLDFLPFEWRTVRRDGIRLFNIRYWDSVLTLWVGQPGQMLVKYDPRDLSRIFLLAPDGSHVVIPYANLGRPAIAKWEQRRALEALRREGRAAVDEGQIFKAVEAQRTLVANAIQRTLRSRRTAARIPSGQGTSAVRTPLAENSVAADGDQRVSGDDYLPYTVEDWS